MDDTTPVRGCGCTSCLKFWAGPRGLIMAAEIDAARGGGPPVDADR